MASTKASPKVSSVRRMPRTIAAKPAIDAAREHILQQYELAVRLMHEGKFDKAHTAFEKLLAAAPVDLADRIRIYLAACIKQSEKITAKFSSPEEQYDYAIVLLNDGNYTDSRQHLEDVLKKHPKADFAFYGLAILASITGDSNSCLEHLTEAIRLNTRNRIQARSDADFQDMTDDPRFTELLYPEA